MKYKPSNPELGSKCAICGAQWGQHFHDECPEEHLSPSEIESLTAKNLAPKSIPSQISELINRNVELRIAVIKERDITAEIIYCFDSMRKSIEIIRGIIKEL